MATDPSSVAMMAIKGNENERPLDTFPFLKLPADLKEIIKLAIPQDLNLEIYDPGQDCGWCVPTEHIGSEVSYLNIDESPPNSLSHISDQLNTYAEQLSTYAALRRVEELSAEARGKQP
jgi:hypothetical protein